MHGQEILGMDRILDSIIIRLGNLKKAILINDYAKGKDTGIIDLVLVRGIDPHHLNDLSHKTELHIKRKLRTLVFDQGGIHHIRAAASKKRNGGVMRQGIGIGENNPRNNDSSGRENSVCLVKFCGRIGFKIKSVIACHSYR